jgi:uncharacterized protein
LRIAIHKSLPKRVRNSPSSEMPLLDHATVLITGASSGLGAEFARQVAPRAKAVVLAARRMDRLNALRDEIGRPGLTVHCMPLNVADPAELSRFIENARPLGVNVLINNAGVGDHGLFEDSRWDRIADMIDVNIRGLTQLTHGLVKDLIAKGDSGILNVSSIASLLPLPQMAVYAATKAYVTSFSEALRAELRGTGVRVSALCPGPVDTEFFVIAERQGSDGSQAAPSLMKVSAREVVRKGLAALEAGRPRVVPGWFVASVMKATELAPTFVKRIFLNRRGRGFTGH